MDAKQSGYKEARLKEKDEAALRWLLNDEMGRWLITKLEDESFLYIPATPGNPTDAVWREGRKSLILDLLAQINGLGRQEKLLLIKAQGERQMWREDIKDSFKGKEIK